MPSSPRLSIILPTYNEAGNIIDLIRLIRLQLPSEWTHEFWVIDDNSPDGTYAAVLNAFREDQSVNVLLKTHERGLAAAIGTGIQKAVGEFVLVMDTDFTHRPEEIPRMLQIIQACDLVSGSRFCSGGRMTNTGHYIASFLFNVILRIILRTQIQDNLGGYWVARRTTILMLDFDIIFKGYGDYFFKLLKLLHLSKACIVEIPAFYAARQKGNSKSNFFNLLGKYTFSALAFKLKLETQK